MNPSIPTKDPNHTLEEFRALRAEILMRIQLRSGLLALAITMFAGAIALATKDSIPVEIVFIFPFLACFIALEWSYHDLRIFAVATYIKKEIEPVLTGIGWQHYLDATRQHRILRITSLAAVGIFVGASILALLFTYPHREKLFATYGRWTWVIYSVDVGAILISWWSLRIRRVDKVIYKPNSINS